MQALANVELFLRSKRKHYALMEKYNPLYGMSDKDRIRATARTVGLQVPTKDKPNLRCMYTRINIISTVVKVVIYKRLSIIRPIRV